jgi:hypothetical protein
MIPTLCSLIAGGGSVALLFANLTGRTTNDLIEDPTPLQDQTIAGVLLAVVTLVVGWIV